MVPALLTLMATPEVSVELYRGLSLGQPGYWAVEDAIIDRSEPDLDHGGGYTLSAGDGRTVLIRFGDLVRTLGRSGVRIKDARLVLTPSGGGVPTLKAVTAVSVPWGEGPAVVALPPSTGAKPEKDKDGKVKDVKPMAARGAATHNEARAGLVRWKTPGVPDGAPISATGALAGKGYEIRGLGATVQGWIDRPWTNHGLALAFSSDAEFFSSQSPSGRPRLIVETEPIVRTTVVRPDLAIEGIQRSGPGWLARVANRGSGPSVPTVVRWTAGGKAAGEAPVAAIAPGMTLDVPYPGPEPVVDGSVPSLAAEVVADEADGEPSNDRRDVFVNATPVDLVVRLGFDPNDAIDYWNETVCRQSRFSFAPDGVRPRVRLGTVTVASVGVDDLPKALRAIGTVLGLPSGPTDAPSPDLFPGLMGYGDTRFEGNLPGRLPLAYEPVPDAATDAALLEPTGLLAGTDVARLNDPARPYPMPKAVVLRVSDLVGRPLANVELTAEAPGSEPFTLRTSVNGSVLLPRRGPDGVFGTLDPRLANGRIAVRATLQGIMVAGSIRAWQIVQEFLRSGSPALVIDLRLNAPMLPLERETNLASERIASDSASTAPSRLAALTDGDPETSVALPETPGSWIEIDLQRDRTVGEIGLALGEGPFAARFDIVAYATGQRPDEATTWFRELNSDWSRRFRSEGRWIPYRAPVQRIRYVRIVNRSGGPGRLGEIRVVPIRLAGTP